MSFCIVFRGCGKGWWRFAQHKSAIIGEQQGGEGKGDDKPDDAQKAAPNGEAEQDDGGIQPHGLSHDFGCEIHVLYELDYNENNAGTEQDDPEVVSGFRGLEECQQNGGQEGDELEIGHQIEQADKQAQTHGKGEVYDEEADAEQYAHKEGNERLAAEIGVHAVLYVLNQRYGKGALAGGNEVGPPVANQLIVEQYKEGIEQDDKASHHTHGYVDGAGDEVPELQQDVLHQLGEVALLGQLRDGVAVYIPFNEAVGIFCDVLVADGLVHYDVEQAVDLAELLYGGGYHKHQQAGDDREHHKQGRHNAEDAAAKPCLVLQEAHQRIEHIGQQPCHKEWYQHCTETAHHEDGQYDDGHYNQTADKEVEGDSLVQHGVFPFVLFDNVFLCGVCFLQGCPLTGLSLSVMPIFAQIYDI